MYSTLYTIRSVHVENDHRNLLVMLTMNKTKLQLFHPSAALHKAVLLVFVSCFYMSSLPELIMKSDHDDSFSIGSYSTFEQKNKPVK